MGNMHEPEPSEGEVQGHGTWGACGSGPGGGVHLSFAWGLTLVLQPQSHGMAAVLLRITRS